LFVVGEAFSLDHRGWKAAPAEKIPTYLEAGLLYRQESLFVVGETFCLDHRGWEAAPTKGNINLLGSFQN
jgi:hypothetical protein